MLVKMGFRAGLILYVALCCSAQPPARSVAVTIDDLPVGGGEPLPCRPAGILPVNRRLLAPFRDEHIPLIGFVNEGRCRALSAAGLREVLEMWLDAGASLGNHTLTHADYHTTPLEAFESEIIRGETVTKAALARRGQSLRFFRHPFLHTGLTLEAKRALEDFLSSRGYTIAPVTIDNSDYMFAAVYADALDRDDRALAERVRQAYLQFTESVFAFLETRSIEVAGREFPQILLIHDNRLNAAIAPQLIRMIRARGYSFVSLDKALEDAAYRLPDRYAGPGGFSWIHRWSKTKGMPPKGEPPEPDFIVQKYQELRATPAPPR